MMINHGLVFYFRRPGILVLVNDTDWELLVSVVEHVYCGSCEIFGLCKYFF